MQGADFFGALSDVEKTSQIPPSHVGIYEVLINVYNNGVKEDSNSGKVNHGTQHKQRCL